MGQQFLDFEGTKILANKIKEGERKVVFVGSDNAGSNGWYKVASQTCSGYDNTNITFMVTSTYVNTDFGILQLQIRSDNTNIKCNSLSWLTRTGFDPNHYAIAIDGMTWTLYAYLPVGQFGRLCFEILSMSGRSGKNMLWTLNFSDNLNKETTNPTLTKKSSDGATVNHANTTSKLQTARTINGVSFDGSSNISINSMTTGSNITLFADSDSSSTTEYASIKAGGNELKITSSGGGSSPAKNNNNLTFNGNVVYHTGKKPTPSEIGASPSNHNHDDRYYTESEINSKINTINNNINGKANSNHNHTSITNNFNKVDVDTGFDYCGLNKKNNIDLNSWFGVSISNRCEGAETPVGSVNFSVNARNGDVWSRGNIFAQGNQKVYHTGNKPTPREIGAEEKYSGELRDFNNDFNNVLTQGSYSFGGNIANCPVGENKYGKLIVILNDGGTHDNLNNWIWQFILFTDCENGSIYYRNKTNQMGWSEWKLITERQDPMSFMNGWSYQSGAVNVSRNGKTCSMNVIVKGGNVSDGTVIITVPPAYRPASNRWFTVPVYSNSSSFYWKKVVLYPDGRLCCDGSLSYNYSVYLNLTYIL